MIFVWSSAADLLLPLLLIVATGIKRYALARRWACKSLRSFQRNDLFGMKTFAALRRAHKEQKLFYEISNFMGIRSEDPQTLERKCFGSKSFSIRDSESF